MVQLIAYQNEQEEMKQLIQQFWFSHNQELLTDEEVNQDLMSWTQKGHQLYFVLYENENVGFLHLGSRGASMDWLEDLFVLPQYQGKGIGSQAIACAEQMVKEYSDSLYIEAAARNEKAIQLYRKLGYDCLNTITLRKDFKSSQHTCLRKVKLFSYEFEIRKLK